MNQTPQETLQDTFKRLYSKDEFLESLKNSSVRILYTTETPPKEAMTDQEDEVPQQVDAPVQQTAQPEQTQAPKARTQLELEL